MLPSTANSTPLLPWGKVLPSSHKALGRGGRKAAEVPRGSPGMGAPRKPALGLSRRQLERGSLSSRGVRQWAS